MAVAVSSRNDSDLIIQSGTNTREIDPVTLVAGFFITGSTPLSPIPSLHSCSIYIIPIWLILLKYAAEKN